MDWVYLALATLGCALTVIVWHPPRGRANIIGFLVGWLYGELALHHVMAQVLVMAGFSAAGWLDSRLGHIGFAVALAGWVGLTAHWLTGLRNAPRVEAALARCFGPDYAQRIPPDTRSTLRRRIDWASVAWPFSPRRGHAVRRRRDIPFARAGGVDLLLDVYGPAAGGTGLPVLLQIHGGAWTLGTKNDQALPLMYHMAERGWLCVALSYRLSPRATYPDHLIDCKRGLAWVREHIAAYGGDPDFIVATGGSAGGHLCSMLALTPDESDLQPGFESADLRLQGCIPFYGVYDWAGRSPRPQHAPMLQLLERTVVKKRLDDDPLAFRQASPMWRVRSDAPPFLVVHGDVDSLVAVEDGRDFAELLEKESSAPVAYLEILGAQHAFEIIDSVRAQHAVNAAARFCAVIHSDYLAKRRRPARPRAVFGQ